MKFTVPVAMFGWPLVVLYLFATLPKRRAMLIAMAAGWLFLPQYEFALVGPLYWSKVNAVSISVALAAILFDSKRIFSFRPRWFDLPAIASSFIPIVSSLLNGLGPSDALAGAITNACIFSIPYFLGRIYITTMEGLSEASRIMLAGVLCYVPLCAWELRMSPLLHYHIYGFFQHQWAQMVRDGGYRPIVFMQHALAVAMWMAAGTVLIYGLWRRCNCKRMWGVPSWLIWCILLTMTVECKCTGAMALVVCGCCLVEAARFAMWRSILIAVILVSPAYIVVRGSGLLTAERTSNLLQVVFPIDRVYSAQDRLHQEDVVLTRVRQSPFFGNGPWGGFLFDNQQGRVETVAHVDSMWVITLGKYGIVGLLAGISIYLVGPLLLAFSSKPGNSWGNSSSLLVVSSVLLSLVMIDNLSNFMPNPVFLLIAGATTTLASRSFALAKNELQINSAVAYSKSAPSTQRRVRIADAK